MLTLESKHVAWLEMTRGELSSPFFADTCSRSIQQPALLHWRKLNPVLKVRCELEKICQQFIVSQVQNNLSLPFAHVIPTQNSF